jgi:hypothetical protein
MASAGIRKTPTGRYKVWWRLDDASQGSQTFDTRDQARDFKHDLLARLARGSWVDPQLGRQTFEAWAREWWEGWSGNADYSPRTLQAAEARLRRYLRRLGLSDDGEGVAGCLGGCSGAGSAADRQAGTTYRNDRCMTSGRRRL